MNGAAKDDRIEVTSTLAADVLDERVFHVPSSLREAFDRLLDAPVIPNRGLAELFAKPSVWNTR
ncbi:hypothetical protein QUV83_06260 [Cellulomonas cellasea]|uniref:hypothetical protein n=1 Tax=Cellulomonas cellasea TaxID=43670 RepID=UPI0025A3F349|nr:hypothetical protein [Cellulomonas cellasea]MDM8084362.1 hypothetical protein [Cellulomonas cellasea]